MKRIFLILSVLLALQPSTAQSSLFDACEHLINTNEARQLKKIYTDDAHMKVSDPLDGDKLKFQHMDRLSLVWSQQENHAFEGPLIPLISHHMWLVREGKPREVSAEDLKNLKHTLKTMDKKASQPWRHIFWTYRVDLIPQTIKKLRKMNIEVRDLVHYGKKIKTLKTALLYLNNPAIGGMGAAVDLLRYDILHKFGGFYADLNYVLENSPEPYHRAYHFFVSEHIENYMFGIENYMFASARGHPILKEAIDVSMTYLTLPTLMSSVQGCGVRYIPDEMTFVPFVYAYFNNANHYGTMNFAIPNNSNNYNNINADDNVSGVCYTTSGNGTRTAGPCSWYPKCYLPDHSLFNASSTSYEHSCLFQKTNSCLFQKTKGFLIEELVLSKMKGPDAEGPLHKDTSKKPLKFCPLILLGHDGKKGQSWIEEGARQSSGSLPVESDDRCPMWVYDYDLGQYKKNPQSLEIEPMEVCPLKADQGAI